MSLASLVSTFVQTVEKAVTDHRSLLSQMNSQIDLNHTFGFIQGLSKCVDLVKNIEAQIAAAPAETPIPTSDMTATPGADSAPQAAE